MPEVRTDGRRVPEGMEPASLLLALLVVLLIAFFSYRAWSAFNRNSEQLAITQQLMESTNALLSSLTTAETSQRGFLLTGRARYLDSYNQATAAIPGLLESLTQVTATRADEAKRVESLKPLVHDKLEELQETVELGATKGGEAALAIVLTDRGKLLMDQIRQLCTQIQSVAYGRLTGEAERGRENANLIGSVATAGSLALFALLILSVVTIQKGTRRRQELIEDLQKSEDQVKLANDWLQTTIRSIGDGVVVTDAAGKVVLLNQVAESLTGWTLEHATGLPLETVFVITNEKTGETVNNPVAQVLREGRIVGLANHTNLTSKDGKQIPIEDSAAPIRNASGHTTGVVLVFRDVSERREAERKASLAALQLAALARIIESSDDAIISKNLRGEVTSWNLGAERIFGYTKEEMIGRPISILASPGRADEMPIILQRIANGEHIDHYETMRRTKAGHDIHISLTVSPIRDSEGKIVGASKISRDITERITADRERRRQAELIARSNADLQHFVFAASHDLREPLRTIAVYSQILERRLQAQLDGESSGNFQAIVSAVGRMSQLIDGLLEYSKVGESDISVEEIDTQSAFAAALANLQGTIQNNEAIITQDALPKVRVNQLHLVQLFQNLIGNALKYRGKDAPVIHVSAQRQGDEWLFSIRDNGEGIAPEYHLQIFEIFKRLHGPDQPGSGIGLATCKKIIDQRGGKMWVESEVGAGATFFFTLPA